MCMTSETVEALHALTSELKAEHERMAKWLAEFDEPLPSGCSGPSTEHLAVTRAEAERIFADRIAAHEARLKEQGWTRTVRVEAGSAGGNGAGAMPPVNKGTTSGPGFDVNI